MENNTAKSTPRTWSARARATFGSGGWGLGGALVASLCCAPPAVAFALGLGGSAFLVGLGQYQPYFVLAGLMIMAPVGWRLLRPVGRCEARERRTRISRLALMLAVFGGGYLAISYLLLPWLYAIG
jgi:hypothetical protein